MHALLFRATARAVRTMRKAEIEEKLENMATAAGALNGERFFARQCTENLVPVTAVLENFLSFFNVR